VALPQLPEGFDVNDPDLYAVRLPRAEWEELRRTTPVWWQSQPKHRDGFDDEGHWVLTRHADVKEVSRKDAVFSTYENTAIIHRHEQLAGYLQASTWVLAVLVAVLVAIAWWPSRTTTRCPTRTTAMG